MTDDFVSTGGRLSPENIEDVLLRGELYREIRASQYSGKQHDGWIAYTVQQADTLSPELIAFKVYTLDTLKWVIMIAALLDEPRERLEAGVVLYLPTLAWIRERIKYYMTFEKKGVQL